MSGVPVTFYLIPIESPEEVEFLDSAGDLLGGVGQGYLLFNIFL